MSFLKSAPYSYIMIVIFLLFVSWEYNKYVKTLKIKEEENKITTDTRIIAELLAKIGAFLFIALVLCAERLDDIYKLLQN